jgi:hypothetical protein
VHKLANLEIVISRMMHDTVDNATRLPEKVRDLHDTVSNAIGRFRTIA